MGNLPIVRKYMKGIFELKPVFPKYTVIWNVSKVFNYFRAMVPPWQLTLKDLSLKLCVLLILLTGGQRCQTIHSINITDMSVVDGKLIIPIMSKIKQSKPTSHMAPLKIKPYHEENLCLMKTYVYLSTTHQTFTNGYTPLH